MSEKLKKDLIKKFKNGASFIQARETDQSSTAILWDAILNLSARIEVLEKEAAGGKTSKAKPRPGSKETTA